nr:unnamed protein product [Callosobruchus analis]
MIAYIFCLVHNCRHPNDTRTGELSVEEQVLAEDFVFKVIQQEFFAGVDDPRIASLSPFCDKEGLIRMKSRVSNREDTENYRFPIILHAKHAFVHRLIMDTHVKSCHVGTRGLLGLLREKYWILGGRRSVRTVVAKCVVCIPFQPIELETLWLSKIQWRFNPPAAPWWGGFWERLIGVLKRLEKTLGCASLDYDDLTTVLCECESVVNSRPLTCLSEDPKDFVALSPSMFLRDQFKTGLPDCDAVDHMSLCEGLRKIQSLRESLRSRFRAEYLGQLKLIKDKKKHHSVEVGDLVIVSSDNMRRLEWPIARVVEVLSGRDSNVHLVRVGTSSGRMLRPVQRLYPLECCPVQRLPDVKCGEQRDTLEDEDHPSMDDSEDSHDVGAGVHSRVSNVNKVRVSRSGRVLRTPSRFDDF